jgi:hypothetical protein
MSAEDILDKWFGGPGGKSKNVNPRELLKELPPVSLGGRRDYATAIELGNKRGTKLELKYPSWGLYPRHELAELLTMIRIDFIKSLIVLNGGSRPKPKIQMPEAENQKVISREKAYQEFMSKKR